MAEDRQVQDRERPRRAFAACAEWGQEAIWRLEPLPPVPRLWIEAARTIREAPSLPETLLEVVDQFWKIIWESAFRQRLAVYVNLASGSVAPTWWKAAYGLMVVADEACADVGYDGHATQAD